MGSPRHLWTGGWRAESERAREADDGTAELRQPPQQQAPASTDVPDTGPSDRPSGGSRRLSLLLGLMLAAAAIAGGAFAAGMLLDGNHTDSETNALPAVSSEPIKPHRGETRAGAIYAAASPAVTSIRTNVGEGTGFLVDKGRGML